MWLDDKGKKSKISAPQYVDYVMTYVQKVVNDEATFPTKHGNEFPANFEQVLRKIQKLLFHVVAHIYHSHFREVRDNGYCVEHCSVNLFRKHKKWSKN